MKTKKIPVFYIFLLVLVVLVLILTEVGKSYLTDVLDEYENSQYKYVADDILQTYFVSGDSEALTELFAAQISEMESKESVAAVFDTLTAGKTFSLQSVSTDLTGKIEYVVKCDDKRFATLTLEESGEKTKNGFALYKLAEAHLNENLFFSRSIEIPVGYSLKVNGFDAGIEYCMNDRIATASKEHMPEGLLGIEYTTYTFPSLLDEPSFEVTSPLGNPAEIVCMDNGVYSAAVVYDQVLSEELSAYVIDATEAYACYLQKDATFGTVAKYLDPSSQLYQNIRTSPNWMVIDHNSYAFEDAAVSEYYAYSDTVFSCRVTLTHVLKYRGLQDYRDYIDITWHLIESNGKYLIYDSFNHN